MPEISRKKTRFYIDLKNRLKNKTILLINVKRNIHSDKLAVLLLVSKCLCFHSYNNFINLTNGTTLMEGGLIRFLDVAHRSENIISSCC